MVGSGQAVFTGRQHHLGEGEMIQIGDDARIGGRQSSAQRAAEPLPHLLHLVRSIRMTWPCINMDDPTGVAWSRRGIQPGFGNWINADKQIYPARLERLQYT
ncbi:MAG TPA: hypothetical protein DEB52_13715, partial [Hyphomonas sp.]|nr:hypothetical protein [Hyphomonas sp.]